MDAPAIAVSADPAACARVTTAVYTALQYSAPKSAVLVVIKAGDSWLAYHPWAGERTILFVLDSRFQLVTTILHS